MPGGRMRDRLSEREYKHVTDHHRATELEETDNYALGVEHHIEPEQAEQIREQAK